MHTVFACDIWTASQRWLQNLGVQPILGDMNTRIWDGAAKQITTKDMHGKALKISTRDEEIDLYVCGFMCTPFTPNGKRKEWADEHSRTFFSAVKTISALKPRVAILENVMAISNNSNAKIVKKTLAKLTGYVICYLKSNSLDHGIPQHRPRMYMVAIRKEGALKSIFEGRAQEVLERFLQRKIGRCQQPCQVNFREWLADMGHPIKVNMMSERSDEVDEEQCTCTRLAAVCILHPCKCNECSHHGEKALQCKWRHRHRLHRKNANCIKKRRKYLLAWRKVKKDNCLKSVPDYFALARKRGLDTQLVSQRSRRDLLSIYSQESNIMRDTCILNLSKSLGRVSLRSDGFVPTLGHGCSGFFVPSAAAYLDLHQLMCLTGFDPSAHKKVFEVITEHSESDLDIMIGNAMCLPLVGAVAACALSMIE